MKSITHRAVESRDVKIKLGKSKLEFEPDVEEFRVEPQAKDAYDRWKADHHYSKPTDALNEIITGYLSMHGYLPEISAPYGSSRPALSPAEYDREVNQVIAQCLIECGFDNYFEAARYIILEGGPILEKRGWPNGRKEKAEQKRA